MCELVTVSGVVHLSDNVIIHSLRAQVQQLHGDYGAALIQLSLRGIMPAHVFACCRVNSSHTCN